MATNSDASIRAATERYFQGERRDALVFAFWGALNIGGAAAIWRLAPDQRLLALALLTIGVLQLVPGIWAFRRHTLRLAGAREQLATAPASFQAAEGDRLRRLLDARRRLRIADVAFFAAFVAVVLLAPPAERMTRLAVPGQLVLLPLLNVAMERRARRFAEALSQPAPA